VVVALVELPGQDQPPSLRRSSASWDIRYPIFDLINPAYILDDHFYLLDWNPAFDEVIAKPLKLVRGRDHVWVFVQNLANREDVMRHAKDRYGGERAPLVDSEIFVFQSPSFGELRFRKIAAQITDEAGNPKGWSVALNVLDAGPGEGAWPAVLARIEEEVSWSRYAASYDTMLLEFPEYRDLVAEVTRGVGTQSRRVIDLGAGTGNGTLQLLHDRADLEVWAVELSETMLRTFRAKLAQEDPEIVDRLTVLKENIHRLDGLPDASFDAAVMINVLYAVSDRETLLGNVNRILKPGGVLSLSTPHRGTDTSRLFDALQRGLEKRGLLEEYQEQLDAALARHEAMDDLIHMDSVADILALLRRQGFEPEGEPRSAYVDSVVVIRATKARKPARPVVASPGQKP
jgi:ubiquinone/menaquinone biosynthesis C-methylase UbiE